MPEAYGELGLEVPTGKDEATGADVPASFRRYTDSLDEALTDTKGKLFIAQGTGAAAFKAMKGDAALAEDGTLTIGAGAVSTLEIEDEAVTPVKLADSAVEEAKIADGAATSRKLKPTTGVKLYTEVLELSAAMEDIPNTTLELTTIAPSILLIDAFWEYTMLEGDPSATTGGRGTIRVDGVDSTPQALFWAFKLPESQKLYGSVTMPYMVNLTAATHTIKLRAKRAGSKKVSIEGNTGYRYMLFAS